MASGYCMGQCSFILFIYLFIYFDNVALESRDIKQRQAGGSASSILGEVKEAS